MHANVIAFAEKNQLVIEERLGFGIHGSVFSARGPKYPGQIAVKHFSDPEAYLREFEVYRRLDELRVRSVSGFFVPELLLADEILLILAMTVVTRPFVLDFAGAYVDFKPFFSEEIQAEWEAQKRDQYGDRWPIVRKVLDEFEAMDIYIIDVSPSNIAF